MPDTFGAEGLQLKTLTELRAELDSAFKTIYGADISTAQDTPDGQLINIFAQMAADMREKLLEINSSFDPDQAAGVTLDQRVGINGILRNEGTYTRTPVTITTDREITLTGLDTTTEPYAVKDDAGTVFLLEEGDTLAIGANVLSFRAREIGAVLVGLNTITNQETIEAGVISVNNPDPVTIVGVDEETDADLKIRRRRSVAIASEGYLESIEASIANISGVTAVTAIANETDTTDADGTPAHTLWILVEGGDDDEIAQAIYAKKSAGAGLRGDEEVIITRPNGRTYTVYFDRPTAQDLYIRFSLQIPGGLLDTDFVKDKIVEDIIWRVGEDALADVITCYVKGIDERFRITGMQISDDGLAWGEIVEPTSIIHRFVNDQARITIT